MALHTMAQRSMFARNTKPLPAASLAQICFYYSAANETYSILDSFGIVLYEIATGSLPFHDKVHLSLFELANYVIDGGRPAVPGNVPSGYRSLMVSCWASDPAERPTFAEVVQSLDPESEGWYSIVQRSKHRRRSVVQRQSQSLQDSEL